MTFTSATVGPQGSVIYFGNSPTVTKYAAGSRSWRTNNPGLLALGVLTTRHGAIGQVLGVAVFQNPEQGRNALMAALADEEFAGLTVPQALDRLIALYTPPPRKSDPVTGEPLPWREPETGVDLELTMSAVGSGDRKALAYLVERRLQYVPGLITQEPLDTGTLNQAKRPSDSPGNLLINGRSIVHTGSGGTLSTIDVCETPSGKGCKTVVYTNVAKSADAAQTASLFKVNGNPACTEDSIFSKSSGDEAGRCGGVRSGTIKGKAEVVNAATNVRIEGKGALRQFDLMVSNNQNTPPAPVQQGGGARPDFLDAVGTKSKEAAPPPWRFDIRIGGGQVKQLGGRWVRKKRILKEKEAQTDPDSFLPASATASTTIVATDGDGPDNSDTIQAGKVAPNGRDESLQMMDHGLRDAQRQEQLRNLERVLKPVGEWWEGVKERVNLLGTDPLEAIAQAMYKTYPFSKKITDVDALQVLNRAHEEDRILDRQAFDELLGSMPLSGVAGITKRILNKAQNKSNEIARISKTLEFRKRALELSLDPDRGQLLVREGIGAARFEQATGRTVVRSTDGATDFIDPKIGPFDLKGPLRANDGSPIDITPKRIEGLGNSVIKEGNISTASKAVVVDTLGLTKEQISTLKIQIQNGLKTNKPIIYIE